ncbi:hypothetical protein K1X12_13385 [Hyphomonas sp. WL0036]|uniref:hypothetical protein n=1 Tax=Hyphomonas sediminis TaxID=2866160 RepID=UPI001C7E529B|nr:hypothetical protein [Hyphomonas sediminis]MBY9067897.1 hypothetical protein [Hyphomonas sediminis]
MVRSIICRFAMGAVVLFAGAPQLPSQVTSAQAIERYSAESLWLSQAGLSMQNFVGMLEPIFDVTIALTSDAPSEESYQSQAITAIETARSRLGMIHENAVWMIEALPDRPVTTNRLASELIGKVGDPKMRAGELRGMSDAIISNFEASLSGDAIARDQGLLAVVALLDELALINDFVVEIEAAHVEGGHPIMVHALRADKESLRSIVRVRQLEFTMGLSAPGDAVGQATAALVESVKGMRTESDRAVREIAAYKRQMAGNPYFSEREKKLLKEYQDTEEVRARFVSAMGSVIYQSTRPDIDPDALSGSMEKAFALVPYMDPAHRESEKSRGRSAMPPPDTGAAEGSANL